ncbi:MAG: helix-hairpin-helix domain-containing protein [Bacteroidetes bacterium]|nr:MAG: helix-hairpin-helix domain-containing protein [Bacteroidota bacterium]
MKHVFTILLLFIIIPAVCRAQFDVMQDVLKKSESILENEIEKNEQSQEDYTQFEAIEQFSHSPLKLNSASELELRSFPYLNEFQIQAILKHRQNYGHFIALEELQVVDGFNADNIRTIKPMLSIGQSAGQKNISVRNIIKEGQSTIMFRYQKYLTKETDEQSYPGTPEKLYLRYKYQLADRIRLGLTAEKDPGEYFFQNSVSKGFDFYSGHLIIKSRSFLRQVSLGDYSVQHGQGLVMWSGMGFGKSSEVLAIQKTGGAIKPYTSVDENNYLRGICLSTTIKNWNSDFFYSSHRKDGNLQIVEDRETVSSLQSSGYHRTEAELEDRKSVKETIIGTKIDKSFGALKLGSIAYLTKFSKPIEKEKALYNQFEFRGSENLNYGINGSYLYKNISSFAEISRSLNGGTAILFGSLIHLHPKLSYAFTWRNYDSDYQALQSGGFAENSKTANENGIFSGIQLRLPKNLILSAYADYFVFPWLKFGVDAPSSGYEYLIQLKWKPKRTFETYLLFKSKTKEQNAASTNATLNHLEKNRHCNFRWNLRIKLSDSWDWGSRIENSFNKKANQKNTYGFVLYQDLIFHPLNSPISFGLRYALFETEDYDTRIYAYENDVLFSYSIPAMQGKGERMYINVHYRMSRLFEIWLRFANTRYAKEIPSAEVPNGIKEAKKEIKVQIRIRF